MWRGTHYVGRGGPASFAISAMDIALWDLKAKALQEPLWRLLGGYEPRVPAYASGIDLHLTLEELVAQTRHSLDGGFQAIKMKVGLPRLRDDLVRVEAVRALIGADIPLMVDANMAWTVEQAIRASARAGGVRCVLAGGANRALRRQRPRAHPERRRTADRGRRKPALA